MADSGRARGRGRGRGRGGGGEYDGRGGGFRSPGRGDHASPRGGGSQYRGGEGNFSPRGRGGDFSPRGRGNDSPSRGRRGDFQPRGRGDAGRGGGGRGGRGGSPLQAYRPADGAEPKVDEAVTAAENQLVLPRSNRDLDLSKLSIEEELPYRPGFGTQGNKVVLWTNYFQILPSPSVELHRYAVSISPNATARLHRARIIGLFLAESPINTLGAKIASDFQANIISATKLAPDQMRATFKYRGEDEDHPAEKAKTFTVSLDYVTSLSVSDLVNYLTSTNARAAIDNQQPFIQVLNIILGHFPKTYPPCKAFSKIDRRQRSNLLIKVDNADGESFDLTAGLQAWRGYFTSVRTATSRLLVNVQVKHAAMYKHVRLDQLMEGFMKDSSRSLTKLNSFVTRVRVHRIHLDKNGKSAPKTIIGLARKDDGKGSSDLRVEVFGANSTQVKFRVGSKNVPKGLQPGSMVTVLDYFQKAFDIKAHETNRNLPVVNVGTKEKPIYLLAELCLVLAAQPASAKLSPNQTAQMIRFAVRKPFQNAASITENGLPQLGLNPASSVMREFGLDINPRMLAVNARILPTPKLFYHKKPKDPSFGSWNMNGVKFSHPASLRAWSVIWIFSRNPDPWRGNLENLKSTLQDFHGALTSTGMNCPEALLPGAEVRLDEPHDAQRRRNDERSKETVREKIHAAFTEIKQGGRGEELLLVILPFVDGELYSSVKRCGDVQFGIHTVCVEAKKFAKPNNIQYFANLALKFNLKLGGLNQTLDKAGIGFIGQGKTMVVGIDVTHPSPGSLEGTPSIAAMVASTDDSLGQFPGVLKRQAGREEMVFDLADMLKSRLSLWRESNGVLPENIVVYRDGVSEGQYPLVLEKELPKLRIACKGMYSKDRQPALTIVIVGKRHNTRFYPTSVENIDQIDQRSSNTRHGTVVDRGITEARFWDFFLQAHTALQGTARPAHYFVIHDEIFRSMPLPTGCESASDILEGITHNMCYMFGRATKAVSYCPAAYYADLACERGRVYLADLFTPTNTPDPSEASSVGGQGEEDSIEVHDAIKNTMFFL